MTANWRISFQNASFGLKLMVLYCGLNLAWGILYFFLTMKWEYSGSMAQLFIRDVITLAFIGAFVYWKRKEGEDHIALIENIWGYSLIFLSILPTLVFWACGIVSEMSGSKTILMFLWFFVPLLRIAVISMDVLVISAWVRSRRLGMEGIAAVLICLAVLILDEGIVNLIPHGNVTPFGAIAEITVSAFTMYFILRTSVFISSDKCFG